MNQRTFVNAWLADIGREAGTDLHLDDRGQVCFAYDRQVPITLSIPAQGGRLALHAPLLPLFDMDEEQMLAILTRVLTYNLPGVLKTGLALAVDEDAEAVYLVAQPEAAEMDARRFRNILMEFMAEAARLSEELRARMQRSDDRLQPAPAMTAELLRTQSAMPLWG